MSFWLLTKFSHLIKSLRCEILPSQIQTPESNVDCHGKRGCQTDFTTKKVKIAFFLTWPSTVSLFWNYSTSIKLTNCSKRESSFFLTYQRYIILIEISDNSPNKNVQFSQYFKKSVEFKTFLLRYLLAATSNFYNDRKRMLSVTNSGRKACSQVNPYK